VLLLQRAARLRQPSRAGCYRLLAWLPGLRHQSCALLPPLVTLPWLLLLLQAEQRLSSAHQLVCLLAAAGCAAVALCALLGCCLWQQPLLPLLRLLPCEQVLQAVLAAREQPCAPWSWVPLHHPHCHCLRCYHHQQLLLQQQQQQPGCQGVC
jgi:hypothetical protein